MRKSVVAAVVVVLTLFVGSSSLRAQEDQEENGNFEGTYRGFAYAVYTIDGIMNRVLATAPIESFKRPLPNDPPPTPTRVPVYIEATVLQPSAAGPRTFVAFQTTDDGGRREELPTLLAVNTGAFSWDLPLVDLEVGDKITATNTWYLTPSMFDEVSSESTREICGDLLHGGESFGIFDTTDSKRKISGSMTFSILVDTEHCGRVLGISGSLYRWR